MDADCNLLFGVLALQTDFIDADQFIQACTLWTARKETPLADLLVELGWITTADRADIDRLLARKLKKHAGDARAGLATIGDDVKRSLAALQDADIALSLADLPCVSHSILATTEYVPPQQRYELMRLHATGGIGRIWLAHDGELRRDVALKELRPERADNAALWIRFLQEARITGQLEHPGIVPVYELARRHESQQPFYTMRFVKGRTLTDAARAYHRRRKAGNAETLEFVTLLNAFVTVCNTIAYAHARGVLHRDLKGQNVVLGDFGEVVVLDWGLAKVIGCREAEPNAGPVSLDQPEGGSDLTAQGQAVGTPAYMAPEQAAGHLDQLEPRTDVYGLGAILYEILTGQAPFDGPNTEEVLRKVRDQQPQPPRELWSDVPPALEAVCLRALAKAPGDRYPAAVELGRAVQGWQEFERRKAEDALRESEALYHSLVESLPCSVWRKDLDGRFTFANQRFCDLSGHSIEQLLGKNDFDIGPKELAEKYRRDDQRVIATGEVFEDIEEQLSIAVEGERYVHTLKSAVRDAAGNIIGTQGLAWDVTARKLAEKELRKSQERFELVVQGSQDGLWDWDLGTDEVYYSPRYKAMLGYEDHEFPNRSEEWAKRVHPEDIDRVRSEMRAHFESTESLSWVEFRFRHKDGSYRWIRSRAFVLRDPTGRVCRIAGSFEDITDRKNAEEELAYERYLLRSLLDTSPDFIVFKDREGRYIRVNPTFVAKLGLGDPSQVLGKTVHDLFEAEYARASDTEEKEIIRTGQPVVGKDVTITWPDGRATWGSVTKVPLRDPQGHIIGTFAIARDITERKHADQELARERHLLRSFIDSLPEGIYFKDRDGRILRANRTIAETVGCTLAELVGKTDFDLLTPEGARQSFEDEQEIIRTGRPIIGKEQKVTWRDGLTLWVSTTRMPLRDPDGNIVGTFGITRDITQRKLAEETLRKSEERYRSVIAAMQDGIVIVDADGNIRECNAAAERILGLSADQIMGRTPHDPRWRAIHEDRSPFPADAHPLMITLRTGKPCTGVIMGVHKPDGTLTWITVNSQPLFDADGQTLAGVAASFEEITERKRGGRAPPS